MYPRSKPLNAESTLNLILTDDEALLVGVEDADELGVLVGAAVHRVVLRRGRVSEEVAHSVVMSPALITVTVDWEQIKQISITRVTLTAVRELGNNTTFSRPYNKGLKFSNRHPDL